MLWPVEVAQPPTRAWAVGEEFRGYLWWQNTAQPAVSIDLNRVDRAAFNAPGGSIFVDDKGFKLAEDGMGTACGPLRGRLVEEGEVVCVPPGLAVSHGRVEKIFAFSQLYDRIDGRYVRREGCVRTRMVPNTSWDHALPDDPDPIKKGPLPATGLEFLSTRQYEQRFPERVPSRQWRSGGFVLLVRADLSDAVGSRDGVELDHPPGVVV